MSKDKFGKEQQYRPPKGGYGEAEPIFHDVAGEYYDKFDLPTNACSGTDCTGLIQNVPLSDSELESYQAIYNFDASNAVVLQTEKKRDKRGE